MVLDHCERGNEHAVQWGALERVDLNDADGVKDVFTRHQLDAVIHFAAYAYVGESMQDPGMYFRNNVAGTRNLLAAMVEAGVKDLVFSSTCATYGQPETVPITEDTPQRPLNPYGESKLMVEQMLHWYGVLHGLRWAALQVL